MSALCHLSSGFCSLFCVLSLPASAKRYLGSFFTGANFSNYSMCNKIGTNGQEKADKNATDGGSNGDIDAQFEKVCRCLSGNILRAEHSEKKGTCLVARQIENREGYGIAEPYPDSCRSFTASHDKCQGYSYQSLKRYGRGGRNENADGHPHGYITGFTVQCPGSLQPMLNLRFYSFPKGDIFLI